jgi:hypothetical protein
MAMMTEQETDLVLTGTILSDRVDELISNIKPSQESVARRHGVQDYVRQIISRCFHPDQVCVVFALKPAQTRLSKETANQNSTAISSCCFSSKAETACAAYKAEAT